MEAKSSNEQDGVPQRRGLHQSMMSIHGRTMAIPHHHRLPLILHIPTISRPHLPTPCQYQSHDAVPKHGQQVPHRGEQEGEGVAFGGQVAEGLGRIAQEVHHGGAQEDAAGELGAQQEEALVPPVEVGGDAAGEGADQEDEQAPYLDPDQPLVV